MHPRKELLLLALLGSVGAALAFGQPPGGRDLYGDPLPSRAIVRIGTTRFRTSVDPGALYSADGTLLVTTDQDRLVSLWDADGKEVRRFQVPYGYPRPLALSRDAKLLAMNSYGESLFLWDVAKGEEIWRLGKDQSVTSAAFLANGKSLVVASGRWAGGGLRHVPELILRDTGTSKEVRRFEGGAAPVRLSPDGKLLASATDSQGAALWDIPTGKRLYNFNQVGPDYWVSSLAFSSGGEFLAAGWASPNPNASSVVRRWDIQTGKEVGAAIRWWERYLRLVAFSADGKELLTVNEDGRCSAWDPVTGKELRRSELKLPGGERTAALSQDGKTLVTGGFRMRLWDLPTGKERHAECPRPLHFLGLSPDGAIVATGDGEGSLRLWDGKTGKLRHTILENLHTFPQPAFSPDGKVVAAWLPDGSVRQWEAATAKEIRTLTSGLGETRPTYSSDGKLILALAWPNKILVWDAATGKLQRTAEWKRPDGVQGWDDHVLASDGRVLAAALCPPVRSDDSPDPPGSRGVFLWDMASGKLLRSMREPEGQRRPGFRDLAISADARFAAARDERGAIHVWDAATGRRLWQSPQKSGRMNGVALAPDGRLLASAGDDGAVRLWNVATGDELQRFEGHRGPARRVAFTAIGRVLASTGADGNVLLWDVTGFPMSREHDVSMP